MITPQAHFITKESFQRWNNSRVSYGKIESKYEVKLHKTYRELKTKLKEYCEANIDVEGVCVYRTKRSQWGESFEYWKLDNNGKLFIDKEGWS
jgi:hypothetical protein